VRELDPVVAKAMAKRPSDRYASAGEFARAARHAVGVASGERQAAVPRSSRRRILLVAGAVAAALAVAGLALALSSGDDGTPPSGPAATGSLTNVVQRIDPGTGEVMQSIGGINQKAENLRVSGFAAGEGGLWVTNFANLQHVDPVSGTVRANVSIQSPFLTPIVAFRIVWIATDDAVERINPATDELLRSVGLEQLSGIAVPPYIAAGEGAVWVVLDKVLSQIDPATNEIVHETTPVPGSTGIAVGEGAVWVIDKLTGSLTAIDPVTGAAGASADLPGNLDDVVAGGGSVWVLDRAVGTVSVVDPQTLTVDATVRVGDEERNLVFGAGAVWLADGLATTLSRIDPVTRELTTYPMAGPVVDVAVDQDTGTLWVLISDSGDVNP
jgi:YVTN family beta-propeller protein